MVMRTCRGSEKMSACIAGDLVVVNDLCLESQGHIQAEPIDVEGGRSAGSCIDAVAIVQGCQGVVSRRHHEVT